MLFLNCYEYTNKSILVRGADWMLSPLQRALGFKTYTYDSTTSSLVETDRKCKNIFLDICLFPFTLMALPFTWTIKWLDPRTQALNQIYLKRPSTCQPLSEAKSIQTSAATSQGSPLTKEQFSQYVLSTSGSTLEELRGISRTNSPSPQDLLWIGDRFKELAKSIQEMKEKEVGNTIDKECFSLKKEASHMFLFRLKGEERKPSSSSPYSPMTRGDSEMDINFNTMFTAFKGLIQSLPGCLGVAQSRDEDCFFIVLAEITSDPFNDQHVRNTGGFSAALTIRMSGQGKGELSAGGLKITEEPNFLSMPPKFEKMDLFKNL
jgi:hypothetical protein